MKHTIHLAIQIVPLSDQPVYPIIDAAIEVIQNSGVRYTVGPMETVLEGDYDAVMRIAREAQQAALDAGATELVVTMKTHIRKSMPVSFEEKGIERQKL